MLAKSKLSPVKLREAFLKNSDSKISLDMLKVLRQLAPTQDEVRRAKSRTPLDLAHPSPGCRSVGDDVLWVPRRQEQAFKE